MVTKDQEREDLAEQFAEYEAGVSDAIELYMRIEKIYVAASESMSVEEGDVTYVSDSTDVR